MVIFSKKKIEADRLGMRPFKITKAGVGNFSDEEVARHEAGHAIVAALLGLDVWCARLCEPDDVGRGYAMVDTDTPKATSEVCAMVYCGGAAACEATGFGELDFESIIRLGFIEEQIEDLLQSTKDLINANIQALEYCVELLLKKRFIFKDDIQVCIAYNQMYKEEYL